VLALRPEQAYAYPQLQGSEIGSDAGAVMVPQPLSQIPTSHSAIRTEPSLYRRLGGYDVIAAIIDRVMQRMQMDPRFAQCRGGADSEQRGRHQLVGQLCELSGGPCIYIGGGKERPDSGPAITDRDWKATRKHMVRTLSELRVAPKESEEVIALWTRYRHEIVETSAVR
jgi:hemoglobin